MTRRALSKPRLARILAAALVVVVVLIFWVIFRNSTTDRPLDTDEVITYSTDTPDEAKPARGYAWKGKPTDPKYIRLPSIQTEGYIQKVAVDQKSAVAVPNNIHMAGWFVDSVRPGSKGLSIIDGHVDGRTESGIFKNLEKLATHDTFSIEFGDSSIKSFQITEIVTVDEKDTPSILFSQSPHVSSQLNLITCGGSYNRQTHRYEKRVIAKSTALP